MTNDQWKLLRGDYTGCWLNTPVCRPLYSHGKAIYESWQWCMPEHLRYTPGRGRPWITMAPFLAGKSFSEQSDTCDRQLVSSKTSPISILYGEHVKINNKKNRTFNFHMCENRALIFNRMIWGTDTRIFCWWWTFFFHSCPHLQVILATPLNAPKRPYPCGYTGVTAYFPPLITALSITCGKTPFREMTKVSIVLSTAVWNQQLGSWQDGTTTLSQVKHVLFRGSARLNTKTIFPSQHFLHKIPTIYYSLNIKDPFRSYFDLL